MSAEDLYAHVPKKRTAAGALLRNADGLILLVEPTYKPSWEIPGGIVERDESPKAAARREIFEELGLRVELAALLCVDWNSALPPGDEALMFIFDGGMLDGEVAERIRLPQQELASWRWVRLEEAQQLARPRLVRRLAACISASTSGVAAYLEDGV
jgi:8-oxo-dGTP pyrophosphatase MutT (NUDIX family)